MSNKIKFDTAKELNQYLKIETENSIIENGYIWRRDSNESYDEDEHYPAPTLEELLVNSPITIWIHTIVTPNHYRGFEITTWNAKTDVAIDGNLTEAVAQVMLQYYKQINGVKL